MINDLDDYFRALGPRPDVRSRYGVLCGISRDVGERFRQTIRIPYTGHVSFNLQLKDWPEFIGDAPTYLAQIGGFGFEWEPSAEPTASKLEQLKKASASPVRCR